MNERGTIFTSDSVRAILAGRKTVTRRLVKLKPGETVEPVPDGDALVVWKDGASVRSPFPIGSTLWVKEAHAPRYFDDGRPGYRADWTGAAADVVPEPKWKSPLFMPRAIARILLRVVSVRIEKLQDITEADAKAEGVTPFPADPEGNCWTDGKYRTAYEYAWGELHGWEGEKWAMAPWQSNPWVRRIEFSVVTT